MIKDILSIKGEKVVHFDTGLVREAGSWIRGTNARLPHDIAVQWACPVPDEFHARGSATGRRYAYVLLAARHSGERCIMSLFPGDGPPC